MSFPGVVLKWLLAPIRNIKFLLSAKKKKACSYSTDLDFLNLFIISFIKFFNLLQSKQYTQSESKWIRTQQLRCVWFLQCLYVGFVLVGRCFGFFIQGSLQGIFFLFLSAHSSSHPSSPCLCAITNSKEKQQT